MPCDMQLVKIEKNARLIKRTTKIYHCGRVDGTFKATYALYIKSDRAIHYYLERPMI